MERAAQAAGTDPIATGPVSVHVRYFAGARAAAGVSEETMQVEPNGTPVDAATVIEALHERHGRLESVLPACSFLLAGLAVRDRSTAVPDGATLDVLPPFAGG